MILLELFSGIGGFAKGFEQAGFKFDKHYFSEIDRHAIANYKYNFKNAESIGSVTDVSGRNIERPNIITFGFPCQDLSIAGKRKGFGGKRSVLFYEAMRIVSETQPDIFIFENVKGLFSSHNGKDFAAVLRTIADIGLYECEWQLCNTKWVLPQNRERIYFIGHLAGTSKPRVFPIAENDSIPYRKTGTGTGTGQSQTEDNIATSISPKSNARADGTFINVIGNLKGDGGHEVHNVHSTNGISPAVRDNHGCPTITVHNTMPGSGDPKKGGTGHLSKSDGTVYNLDTGNTNAIELKPLFNTGNNSQGERIYDTNGLYSSLGVRQQGANKIYDKLNIRRLTEIECERLQGFPDNWTQYGDYDGEIKKIAKTQRYKLLGNAVTVNIVQLIASRLLKLII